MAKSEPGYLTELQRHYEEEVNKVKKHAEKVAEKLREDEDKLLRRLLSEYEDQKRQVASGIKQSANSRLKFLPEARLLDADNVIMGYTAKVDASKTKVDILKYVLLGDSEMMRIQTFDFSGEGTAGSPDDDNVSIVVSSSANRGRKLNVTSGGDGTHTFNFAADTEGTHSLSISIGGRTIPASPYHVDVLSVMGYVDRMVIGSLVARGTNWEYKDEDGTPPGTGRVTRKQGDGVDVKWDCGNTGTYAVEVTSGYFQLKIAEHH